MILSWSRAERKGTGYMCTIPKIGPQVWGMHPPGDMVPFIVGPHLGTGGMRRITIVETCTDRACRPVPRPIGSTIGRIGGPSVPSEDHRRGWNRDQSTPP